MEPTSLHSFLKSHWEILLRHRKLQRSPLCLPAIIYRHKYEHETIARMLLMRYTMKIVLLYSWQYCFNLLFR